MFWKILLGWMLTGALLEAITYMGAGAYMAVRAVRVGMVEEPDCKNALKAMAHDAIIKHGSWSAFLYKIMPRPVAGVVDLCWTFIVWPFEVPKIILDLKRANDEFHAEYNVSQ